MPFLCENLLSKEASERESPPAGKATNRTQFSTKWVACGGGNGKSYDFHLLNQSVEAYNNVEQDNKILEKSLLDTLRRFASEWCMMDEHQF